MSGDRWVVLALARARTPWFTAVAQWANAGTLPVEYVKCLSVDELRVRLQSARPASAVLLDDRVPGADRDLLADIRAAGCVAAVVGDAFPSAHWRQLGADVVVVELTEPHQLLDLLVPARRITRGEVTVADPLPVTPATWHAKVATVCGAGGTGSSTVAMALAQGLGADGRNGHLVVLADLVRRAELGMLHDAPDVVPGVQELVDAHRLGAPSNDDIRQLTFALPDRGYSLLLGLRRPGAWSALAPHSLEAAFAGLQRAFRVVVCDVDADFEGEAEGGSLDIEERNAMARLAALRADVVFAVGLPGVKGLHSLVRTIADLVELGVAVERVQPVINRAPRSPRSRAELTASLVSLLDGLPLASPIFTPDRRIDECLRDARPFAAALVHPLVGAWQAGLHRSAQGTAVPASLAEPVVERVAPGSLGHWSDDPEELTAG